MEIISPNETRSQTSPKTVVEEYLYFTEKDSLLSHFTDSDRNRIRSRRKSFADSVRSSYSSIKATSLQRCSVIDSGGTASIINEVFNLVKNTVTSATLALPSLIAAFGNEKSAIFPAIFLIIFMGCVDGYYFSLIGRVCAITGATSYRDAWELSVGKRGAFFVSLICVCKPALSNLAYSIILADSLQSLFVTAGLDGFTRDRCLWSITWIVVFPLCLLKNLNELVSSSTLGIFAMLFTVTVMTFRYFDGTYDRYGAGKFLPDLSPEYYPSFGSIGAEGAFSVRVFALLCTLAIACNAHAPVAHNNAPRFFVELHNNTIHRHDVVVKISYAISSILYIIFGVVGFLTFGDNCSGDMLNNYSTNDILATLCRIAIAFSVLFTYPIVFVGVRDGFIDLLLIPIDQQTNLLHVGITILLLLIITIMATCFQNLGMVTTLSGATLATVLTYVFPTLMYHSTIKNLRSRATIHQRMEVLIAMIIMCLGITIGFIGIVTTLCGIEFS